MDIHIYNTLTRKKELFAPLKPGAVTMYSCGPTVYDTPHLGNYRTFAMSDLIRRIFEYGGYAVSQAMNITDVDDKTIRRSREEKIPLKELTERYEKLFLEGLAALHIELPEHIVRATEHIGPMIALIETLLHKGAAYRADDGVYMRISGIKDYGALAGLKPAGLKAERVANDEYDKDDPRDFSLWKFKAADDGGVSWPAPFGEGRPGWHIECSAMAMDAFKSPTIDIHTGGADLMFPHHVNEIAQAEAATGQPFAHYWMHGAFMTFNEEKMAKSKGNVIKLEDLAEPSDGGTPLSPLAYRYWLLTAHYRSPVNFTFEALRAAQNALIRLLAAVSSYPDGGSIIPGYKERFQALVSDDIDLPRGVALVWDLVKDRVQSPADKRATLLDLDRVLGLDLAGAPRPDQESVPPEISALAEAREEARLAKEWDKADALRAEIEARGYDIADDAAGFRIVRK